MTQVEINTQRARRHRAQQLASLGQLPAFQALRNEMELEADKVKARFYAAMFHKDALAADLQRQADYERGYMEGMRFLAVTVIARSVRLLERDMVEEQSEDGKDFWKP